MPSRCLRCMRRGLGPGAARRLCRGDRFWRRNRGAGELHGPGGPRRVSRVDCLTPAPGCAHQRFLCEPGRRMIWRGRQPLLITCMDKGVDMSFIAWIVLGLVAGFIASKIVNKSGAGFILDIVLGVIGAVVGGYLFQTFGMAGVSGVNLYSILVAVVGAVVVLVIYHALRRRA